MSQMPAAARHNEPRSANEFCRVKRQDEASGDDAHRRTDSRCAVAEGVELTRAGRAATQGRRRRRAARCDVLRINKQTDAKNKHTCKHNDRRRNDRSSKRCCRRSRRRRDTCRCCDQRRQSWRRTDLARCTDRCRCTPRRSTNDCRRMPDFDRRTVRPIEASRHFSADTNAGNTQPRHLGTAIAGVVRRAAHGAICSESIRRTLLVELRSRQSAPVGPVVTHRNGAAVAGVVDVALPDARSTDDARRRDHVERTADVAAATLLSVMCEPSG